MQKSVSQVISEFMEMTGCEELYLYGGAAIDRYLNPEAPYNDLDIAITDYATYTKVLDNLRNRGFDVGASRESYNLATVAKHPEYGVFDLSCMDIKKNGIFNLEKFYIKYSSEYPKGLAIDSYGAAAGLQSGRIEIANNPENERAYDLLRRFSVLAGKYDFSLKRGGKNEDTMNAIERRLAETPINEETEHQRTRCLSRFFGAAFRKTPQDKFLDGMARTGLLAYGFPALNETLLTEAFMEDIKQNPAKDKKELLEKLLTHAPDRDALVDELSILRKRERDREDPKVFAVVHSLENEKTSVQRLTNSIVLPLMEYARKNQKG